MRYAYVWRSSQRVAPGSISCAVRGIPLRVLANLRMRCNVELTEAAADEASSALPPIPKPPPLPADLVLAAVERDDPVELERLRQSGTDLCQVDSMKRIALAEAVRGNQIKTLTALLATNCPIDALEPATGRSPLMIASAAYEMPIAQLLLQHGASPSLADARGENAWFLLGAGAAEAGNPDLQVRATMLAQGVDINARNPHGQTLLMLAASAGAYDLAQWLLAKGANLDAQDEAGRTALMHAVTATSGENALPLLLQHRASTKLTDHQGATAMALAQQIGDPSRHRRVLWLLTGG
jgi:ankyrin repeat protein